MSDCLLPFVSPQEVVRNMPTGQVLFEYVQGEQTRSRTKVQGCDMYSSVSHGDVQSTSSYLVDMKLPGFPMMTLSCLLNLVRIELED